MFVSVNSGQLPGVREQPSRRQPLTAYARVLRRRQSSGGNGGGRASGSRVGRRVAHAYDDADAGFLAVAHTAIHRFYEHGLSAWAGVVGQRVGGWSEPVEGARRL